MPVARYQSQHRRVLCTHLGPELALRFQGSLRLRIQVQPTFSKAFLFSVMSSNIKRPSCSLVPIVPERNTHGGFELTVASAGQHPSLNARNCGPVYTRACLSAAFAVLAKKSLVRNFYGKPTSSAQRRVKRHFRVRVLSPQPRSRLTTQRSCPGHFFGYHLSDIQPGGRSL
jgi:hypothetical protein